MQYLISIADKKILQKPEEYVFKKEEEIQEILGLNPEIILNIPELEVEGDSNALACREFQTGSGSIDVLYLTSVGEIVLVETKLIKNPESTRTVVAQVIDYIKSLCTFQVDDFLRKFNEKRLDDEDFDKGERFRHQISEALRHGYFKAVILGDFINPNILGMIESIQAAPHLSFSIFLVEANAKQLNSEISLFPRVVSNTIQVERSVIRLELNIPQEEIKITSEIPTKDREGNKPKKTWGEFIESVDPQRFALIIESFKNNWEKDFPNSISMGIVGFSAGVILGKKRIPIQFVYNNRLAIYSHAQRNKYNIPEILFENYKEDLQKLPQIYDEYVVGGKVEVPFSKLSEGDLDIIFSSAKNLGNRLNNNDIG